VSKLQRAFLHKGRQRRSYTNKLNTTRAVVVKYYSPKTVLFLWVI